MTDLPLLELRIGPIAAGGGCVARAGDGRVVFVRHCLPGEQVMAVVTEETKSYLRADALEIIASSPDRVTPPCPYAGPGRCGGCDWQHVTLAAQRGSKADLVVEQLRRLAGVERAVQVEEVAGAPDGLGWRTRVRFGVDDAGRLGLRKHRSHDLQLVGGCLIASAAVEALRVEEHQWLGVDDLEVFASEESGEGVVSLTTRRRRLGQLPSLEAGLVVNGRLAVDRAAGFRGPWAPLRGQCGRVLAGASRCRARPGPSRVGWARGVAWRPVWPILYSGAGLFAGLVGDLVGPGGSVLAVERDRWACADAARNTSGQLHVEVVKAAVTPASRDRSSTRRGPGGPGPVVRGRREGRHGVLGRLQPGPRRLVYVACDPASFAGDLRVLLDAWLGAPLLKGFDLFPMTEHVELVAVIERPGRS